MGALFGKPGKTNHGHQPQKNTNVQQQVTEKDRAVLELKNARDRLKRYRKKLETESDQLTSKAKELIREQKKDRALLVLKLKKHKEKEFNNIDGQLISILEMIDNIEWETTNLEVMKALQQGNTALNKLHEEMSVDDVENLLAETNEAIETENQINLLLAGQFSVQDDEELQRELAELMGEEAPQPVRVSPQTSATPKSALKAEPPVVPELPIAPSAPVHVLPEAPTHTVEMSEVEKQELAAL